MQGRSFSSFASNMIKLSVNETERSSLLARTRALILYTSIWKFDFGPETLPGPSRNGSLVKAPPLCILLNNIRWSTLSKALLRSKSTQAVNFLSSILRNTSVVWIKDVSVENHPPLFNQFKFEGNNGGFIINKRKKALTTWGGFSFHFQSHVQIIFSIYKTKVSSQRFHLCNVWSHEFKLLKNSSFQKTCFPYLKPDCWKIITSHIYR